MPIGAALPNVTAAPLLVALIAPVTVMLLATVETTALSAVVVALGRMNRIIDSALARQARMAKGEGRFPDNDIVIIAMGGNPTGGPGGAASLHTLDTSIPEIMRTTRPQPFVNTGLHVLNGFDVLYDADRGRADARAAEYVIGHVYESWQAVLDGDADVVAVLLPHDLHARFAVEALAAGHHVVVEKPFAIRTDEADQVLAEGDVVSVDGGCVVDGWHGDSAFTAIVGEPTDPADVDLVEGEVLGDRACLQVQDVCDGRGLQQHEEELMRHGVVADL